ncbi:tqsA [Symbiodinium necroappetens]|uniref:TqsA protein n=1 Tax=Symbiodinium necroappetens TaxID=1628268 RepID=A0A813AI36_9DINO|nr:tqsA [Symbiodinium necroappetens]
MLSSRDSRSNSALAQESCCACFARFISVLFALAVVLFAVLGVATIVIDGAIRVQEDIQLYEIGARQVEARVKIIVKSLSLALPEAFLTTVSEKLMESAKLALSSAVGGLLGYAGKVVFELVMLGLYATWLLSYNGLVENDSTMKMHPVVTLLAVTFFGFVWGPTGMLLSVPMMTYLKAVLLAEYVPAGYRDPLLILIEGDRRAPRRRRLLPCPTRKTLPEQQSQPVFLEHHHCRVTSLPYLLIPCGVVLTMVKSPHRHLHHHHYLHRRHHRHLITSSIATGHNLYERDIRKDWPQ